MLRCTALILTLCFIKSASAVDASDRSTSIIKSGHWQIIEFAAREQVFYRLSSDATNFDEKHLVFDFVPSKKCQPGPALMIFRQESYKPDLNGGMMPFTWKIPGQKQAVDLATTEMEEGADFAFLQLHNLTTKSISHAKDKGNLAIWVTPSGDGTVPRSDSIFFSLEGFTKAYEKAQQLCNDNL